MTDTALQFLSQLSEDYIINAIVMRVKVTMK